MRAVTSATAAAALGVERKAFDNLLARLPEPFQERGKQGVERRIPVGLLPRLLLTVELNARLAVPVRHAFELAGSLLGGQPLNGSFLRFDLDRRALAAEVDRRIEHAIELVSRPPRGRRPKVRPGSTGDSRSAA